VPSWEPERARRPSSVTGGVHVVAVTPDGRHALSGSDDRTLRLWDLENGQCSRTFEGHTRGVHVVAITPEGRYALSGSDDRTLRLWDLESGQNIATFTGESGMMVCAATPNGRTIVVGDESGRVHFLQLVEAEPNKACNW